MIHEWTVEIESWLTRDAKIVDEEECGRTRDSIEMKS